MNEGTAARQYEQTYLVDFGPLGEFGFPSANIVYKITS